MFIFFSLKKLIHKSILSFFSISASIAYVNGQRQGRILEKPFSIGDTIAREKSFSEFSAKNTPLLDIETEIKLAFDSKKTSRDSSMIQELKDLGLERYLFVHSLN